MIDFIHHNMIDVWMKDFISYNNTNVKEKNRCLQQEVKVIWQKAPHGGPIPRLGVTPGGRKLCHW